ncbi:MAG TPA: uroporphyrinogen-III synthase [Burkholderiales bacterium]|nr:uroporphyrinogen-III synthase [Burkholderiales bacterium]
MKQKRIAILESRLGEQVADLVKQRGGVPVHAPALSELPDLDPQKIAALVTSMEAQPPKLVIFQTGVGTKALFAATDALKLTETFLRILDGATVAVRGPKPAGPLRARKVRIDRSAADPFTTHEVLDSIKDLELKGERVIIQRHGSANVELDRALEARGARVTEIPTYRWSLPADTQPLEKLIGALERGEMHAVVFTNAEQVRNLFAVAGKKDALKSALNKTLVASIGPVASAALRDFDIRIGLEAKPPKLGALMSALDSALS